MTTETLAIATTIKEETDRLEELVEEIVTSQHVVIKCDDLQANMLNANQIELILDGLQIGIKKLKTDLNKL